jgi:predicted PurR-regulated permease PerM
MEWLVIGLLTTATILIISILLTIYLLIKSDNLRRQIQVINSSLSGGIISDRIDEIIQRYITKQFDITVVTSIAIPQFYISTTYKPDQDKVFYNIDTCLESI